MIVPGDWVDPTGVIGVWTLDGLGSIPMLGESRVLVLARFDHGLWPGWSAATDLLTRHELLSATDVIVVQGTGFTGIAIPAWFDADDAVNPHGERR